MRKIAFMIHPRGAEDFGRRGGLIIRNLFGYLFGKDQTNNWGIDWEAFGMKYLPNNLIEKTFLNLPGRMGFTICSHFNVFDKIEGYIIAVLMTADQMRKHKKLAQQRIIDAIIFAQDCLGVERVGLGAYTAPMTQYGTAVVRDPRIQISITHGDSLSAASAIPAVIQGAMTKGINVKEATAAVPGAYGIVGEPVSKLLAELGVKKLILTGPQIGSVEGVANRIKILGYKGEIIYSNSNNDIREADIVVPCTSAVGDIVTREMLKENAVVVDMAQPFNMSKKVCDECEGILRIDGGYISIPNIDLRFKMGPPPFVTFACMTELIVSTLIRDTKSHVGKVDIGFAKEIYQKSVELGFPLAPLTNFSEPIKISEAPGVPGDVIDWELKKVAA